jgi:hypothetical protein
VCVCGNRRLFWREILRQQIATEVVFWLWVSGCLRFSGGPTPTIAGGKGGDAEALGLFTRSEKEALIPCQ